MVFRAGLRGRTIRALALLTIALSSAGVAAEEPEAGPAPAASEGAAESTDPEEPPAEPEKPPAEPERPTTWTPPQPSATEFDWVQVDSGEWIKGDFERLRERKVLFDSDKFDEQDLDWHEVVVFYLPRVKTFRLEGRRVLRGTGEMRGSVVRIRTKDGVVHEFERRELVSITRGQGGELDRWSTNLGLGLTARRGNTDTSDLTADAKIMRETAFTRWSAQYTGNFSKTDNEKTANNHRVYSSLKVYITRRLFMEAPFAEYFTDEFSNVDHRVTPGAALGYDVVLGSWIEWDVSLGPAYQYTLLDSVTTGDDDESHDFAGVFTTNIEIDLPRGTDFDTSYRLIPVPTDPDRTSHHFESELSFDIWGPLDLDVSFILDRIENPEKESDGTRPESNDYRVVVGFGLDF